MRDEHWVQRTAVEYADGWNTLLPTGLAWPREPESVLQKVITGQAGIWGAQVEALAALLLTTESDPRATNILLPEWERAFGLPDICTLVASTDIATREVELVKKMTFIGAQSRAFFNGKAAALGQTTTIQEYSPYQCGISGCGDTRDIDPDGLNSYRWGLGPPEMRFVWTVAVTAISADWTGDLYCLFNRWKPAHTLVVFDYSELQEMNFSRPWNSGYVTLL